MREENDSFRKWKVEKTKEVNKLLQLVSFFNIS